jgi:predicted transcriptional regulator
MTIVGKDLTDLQQKIFSEIKKRPGISIFEIANTLHIPKSRVEVCIASFEARGIKLEEIDERLTIYRVEVIHEKTQEPTRALRASEIFSYD